VKDADVVVEVSGVQRLPPQQLNKRKSIKDCTTSARGR
jgi:hypothetical protein